LNFTFTVCALLKIFVRSRRDQEKKCRIGIRQWVLSFMLSFNVIIFCYHFPPFFLFPENVTHSKLLNKMAKKGRAAID
jgi:hypothetical protein